MCAYEVIRFAWRCNEKCWFDGWIEIYFCEFWKRKTISKWLRPLNILCYILSLAPVHHVWELFNNNFSLGSRWGVRLGPRTLWLAAHETRVKNTNRTSSTLRMRFDDFLRQILQQKNRRTQCDTCTVSPHVHQFLFSSISFLCTKFGANVIR